MVDHVQDRRHQAHWEEVQHNVVRYLRDTCQLAQRFSEEEINHVLGVLEVNAFEITLGDGQHRGRGLYPLTALMSHSCLSNTRYVPNSSTKYLFLYCIEMYKPIFSNNFYFVAAKFHGS